MKYKQRSTPNEGIPSSSMADIAFLLIIFFMVTTAFSAKKGIDFNLPRDDQNKSPEDVRAVLIDIDPGGRVTVDGNPFNLTDIKPYLMPKLSANPNKFVIIKTDSDAQYGNMIDVLDELKQLDVKNIALPTREEIASWGEGS